MALVDPRQSGDYPIILGDSLRNGTATKDTFVNVRYNWQPKAGFGHELKGELRLLSNSDKYHLSLSDDGSKDYAYSGRLSIPQNGVVEDGSSTRSLALVFDAEKSAFVLEAISSTMDMNLRQASDLSKDEIRGLPQIAKHLSTIQRPASPTKDAKPHKPSVEDETPDDSNPYDFRHFLTEARENIEKSGGGAAGNRSPFPGNRTPLSGTSTPVPGGNRFLPTTPQFRPAPATTTTKSTSSAGQSHKPVTEKPVHKTNAAPSKTATKRGGPKPSQVLSKDIVSDSSSDGETISVSRPTPVRPPMTTKPVQAQPKPERPSQKHTRNISANIGSSPHIHYDDVSGLEIDEGSDHEDNARKWKGRVNPNAFRSHTGTPVGGLSSNIGSRGAGGLGGLGKASSRTEERPTRRERDGDVKMKDIEAVTSDDDGDVEDFDLGSPRRKSEIPNLGGDITKDEDTASQKQTQIPQATVQAPTPPAVSHNDDDDEELLEAALEAAFEEEDDEAQRNVGLGIGMGGDQMDEDESEVSEEE
jgi:hypothetical protein